MKIIYKYKRRIIQLISVILYNCNFLGYKNANIYQDVLKTYCVPGLNCYSCPGAIGACPVGAFQNFLKQKKWGQNIISRIPLYVIGVLILFGVFFGRVICGFLCPFGFLQELLFKIKTKKIKKSKATYWLSYFKYVILLSVIMIPLLCNNTWFCKYICPAGTIEAGIFHIVMNESLRQSISWLFHWKVIIALIILIMSVFMFRFFCRFICPLGAFYSLFNKISIMGYKIDINKCTHCNKCINNCHMDIKKVGDRECIECGECVNICKEKAIFWKQKNGAHWKK